MTSARDRAERRACRLEIVLETAHGSSRAVLRNLSAGGIGFTTDTLLFLNLGDPLLACHGLIGRVACVVRWAIHPNYGAEFTAAPAARASALAFYDSLAQSPGNAP